MLTISGDNIFGWKMVPILKFSNFICLGWWGWFKIDEKGELFFESYLNYEWEFIVDNMLLNKA